MPRRTIAKSRKFPPEYARFTEPGALPSGGGARGSRPRAHALYGYPNGDARLHRLGTVIFAGRVVQRWCVVA